MNKYSHLSPKLVDFLELPVKERLLKVREIKSKRWIGYPLAMDVLDQLEDLLTHPPSQRMVNFVIYGETNNGKSRLISKFLSRHKPYQIENEQAKVPVVNFEMPPGATPNSFFTNLLDAMLSPFSTSATKDEKFKQVKRILELYETKMIVIDEFNNLVDAMRQYQLQVINTIKVIGNQTQIPIVLVGTPEAKQVIKSNDQTANRYYPIELPQWKLNDDFLDLLVSFEKTIPLKKPSNLASSSISKEIFAMSDGWLGEISELLTLATIQAIKSGEEKISKSLLQKIKWVTPLEKRYSD